MGQAQWMRANCCTGRRIYHLPDREADPIRQPLLGVALRMQCFEGLVCRVQEAEAHYTAPSDCLLHDGQHGYRGSIVMDGWKLSCDDPLRSRSLPTLH